MATEIIMPKLGLTMETGTLVKWHKNEGDSVEKGEVIADMETDKISSAIESPAGGVLLKILYPEGSDVPATVAIGVLGEPGEQVKMDVAPASQQADTISAQPAVSNTPDKQPPARKTGNVKITPAARKLAISLGVDYATLQGTGPDGRITKEDVEAAASHEADSACCPTAPYKGMRKTVGENMRDSWLKAPKVTHHTTVDVLELMEYRMELNETRAKDEKISVTDLLIGIVAKALEKMPQINVSLQDDVITRHSEINIGVAVALEDGLVVPVVRNANKKGLDRINKEVKDLADRARTQSLDLQEMQGGTFTISNLGAYKSVDFFTPIINQPEAAILGIGRTTEVPVAIGGEILIRPMMGLSLAFDHRVIDGAPAAEFLAVLIQLIKEPRSVN